MTERPISPEEARESLELVEATMRQMQRAVVHAGTPYFFLIWGVVWTLGFGSTQVLGPESSLVSVVWMVLDALGAIASFVVGWRVATRLRHPLYSPTIGLFWLTWIAYAALIIYFAQPQSSDQLSLLISLFAMFGYVVTGIFLRSRFLIGLGVALTVVIIGGYLFFLAYYNLWMAVFGGGSLIAVGLYMRYAWR